MHNLFQEKFMAKFGYIGSPTALAGLGVALILISTRWGAFLSDDSYGYIEPARTFLAGQPFVPLGWLGMEPLAGIRVLNAGLFGVNILLSAALVRRLGGDRGFAVLAAAITAFSENTLEAHGWAMREALYLVPRAMFCA
jgi:hypothetical protein